MLAGNSIASLPEITSLQQYNDLFLISEHDKYIYDVFESKHLSASSFLQCVIENIDSLKEFGTMSGEISDDYSLVGHNHDSLYNKIDVQFYSGHPTPTYAKVGPGSIDPDFFYKENKPNVPVPQDVQVVYEFTGYPIKPAKITSYLSVGNIFMDGMLSTFFIPLSCVEDATVIPGDIVNPEIGQFKFVAQDTIASNFDIDIMSEQFDGWVYADGSRFTCAASQFKRACRAYGSGETATSFTVPNFRDFVKFDYQTSDAIRHRDFQNGGDYHYHAANLNVEGAVSAYGEYTAGQSAGDGGYFHTGISDGHPDSIKVKTGNMKIKCFCKVEVENLTIEACAAENVQTYPTHILMPVMVFIGKKEW